MSVVMHMCARVYASLGVCVTVYVCVYRCSEQSSKTAH